uniref:Galectin n=1 Tax=Meloidogyne enterolobii TaxID=390850 RepID=A0A6V7VEQ0_MELEN|nr:unnamed protein product [Meloidogyne enterolobii]
MTNGSIATIRVQINEKAQNFQLLLLHDSPEFNLNIGAAVLLINVNYGNNIINLTSFYGDEYHDNATIKGADIFLKGKPIQITIKMQNGIKSGKSFEFFKIYINDKECCSYKGVFPFWSTNWIQVKGDAVLLEEPFITSPKLQLKETEKIYKYELDQLPFIGSTFCLEGTLPKSTDVEGIEKLVISLMHESNDESESFGDTLLKMKFHFSTEHEESWLKISSQLFTEKKTNEKKYANPIGLSSVELTVRIAIEKSYFKIRFNEGKTFIKYNYVAPPWMVNWIIVKGNIDNVKIGNDAKRCLQYISKQLPPHLTKIENLKEGKYISVKGKVTKLDENILINFYYGALGWDEKRGTIVLQAKITNQNISFCKKFKEKYFCNGVKPLKTKLEIGQIINMVFLATKTNFEIYYDDQEIYQFELPFWAIQYVEVTGPLANIEGRDRIAEIRK